MCPLIGLPRVAVRWLQTCSAAIFARCSSAAVLSARHACKHELRQGRARLSSGTRHCLGFSARPPFQRIPIASAIGHTEMLFAGGTFALRIAAQAKPNLVFKSPDDTSDKDGDVNGTCCSLQSGQQAWNRSQRCDVAVPKRCECDQTEIHKVR